MNVLAKKLRDAGEQAAPDLLVEAADEIVALKRALVAAEGRIETLEGALGEVRDQFNTTVEQALQGYAQVGEVIKNVQIGLSEGQQRVEPVAARLRETRDGMNRDVLKVLGGH